MSRTLVTQLQAPVDQAFDYLFQFMDVCPDDLWAEKNGGWPIWQQMYHLLSAVPAFTETAAPVPDLPAEYGVDAAISFLEKQATALCPKNVMREFATQCRDIANAYIAALDDTSVLAKNATLTTLFEADFTHLSSMTLLAVHSMYHLGGFDAALRNRGMKGIL